MMRVAESSGLLADRGGQRQPVGIRHSGVEQHQGVRPSAGDAVPRASRAASASPTAVGCICQPRSHSSRMRRLVALSSTISTRRSSSGTGGWTVAGSGGCGCRPNRAVKGKVLPRPGSLSTVIAPAHQGHQPGGDGQAQAGAAVLPRGRGVLLLEGPEDPLLLLGRDADARVRDREAQARRSPSVARLAGGFHADDHLARLGELDGVADQVEQHLAQPAGVADQGVGHVRLHVADQLQPLPVGPHGQGPEGVAERARAGRSRPGPAPACRPRSWRSRAGR